MNKLTIRDVAERAGVSIATVSRVLNGKDRVLRSTREKVQSAIEELDFQPDYIARSMVMKETKTVGLLLPGLTNEFWATLAEYIEKSLWERGYTMTLCMIGNEGVDKERAALRSFADKKVDGIIFCVSHLFADYTERHSASGPFDIPGVSFELEISGMSSVQGDHIQASRQAVDHLLDLGHTEIAYIGGPIVSPDRELGYRQALLTRQIAASEALIQRGDPTIAFGREAARRLVDNKTPFTAIFCGNDLMAIGAIQELMSRGLRVPEDISVVGYDDINAAALVTPTLTTVRQPIDLIAQSLVDLLFNRMTGLEQPQQSRKLLFPMELIVRGSTSPLR
ncbi:LacI family DNA-binding transcriptional regulator [Paenibacillus sp. GCM10023252]|uniref:LacI family DNA-binding transcriptional regulator n=1 Tax=Paenibacillus sp. GCM10023252 TaxID=3252649 RepID=UPI0036200537